MGGIGARARGALLRIGAAWGLRARSTHCLRFDRSPIFWHLASAAWRLAFAMQLVRFLRTFLLLPLNRFLHCLILSFRPCVILVVPGVVAAGP